MTPPVNTLAVEVIGGTLPLSIFPLKRIMPIDLVAGYHTATKQALPHAVIVIDYLHLIALANRAPVAVRRRITHEEQEP